MAGWKGKEQDTQAGACGPHVRHRIAISTPPFFSCDSFTLSPAPVETDRAGRAGCSMAGRGGARSIAPLLLTPGQIPQKQVRNRRRALLLSPAVNDHAWYDRGEVTHVLR